jgi:hypothetical protein
MYQSKMFVFANRTASFLGTYFHWTTVPYSTDAGSQTGAKLSASLEIAGLPRVTFARVKPVTHGTDPRITGN